ncbi:hypothetical protein U1Q18_031944 [Sarracenia purpurea var. burkii]
MATNVGQLGHSSLRLCPLWSSWHVMASPLNLRLHLGLKCVGFSPPQIPPDQSHLKPLGLQDPSSSRSGDPGFDSVEHPNLTFQVNLALTADVSNRMPDEICTARVKSVTIWRRKNLTPKIMRHVQQGSRVPSTILEP